MRKLFLTAAICLLSAVVAAAAAAPKSWTVLIYMAADNDLEEFAMDALRQMASIGANPQVNVVILADRGGTHSIQGAGGLSAWKGAKVLLGGKGYFYTLADWGRADMGDPATLAKFLSWGIAKYPASHYALIFWDHGGAWNGFGIDETHSSTLTLDKLEKGIGGGLSSAHLAQLDLVGFDACLMADFESIARLRKYAAYYLGSEALEPGHGWDYKSFSALDANPSIGPLELGKAVASGFMRKAAREKTQGQATLSMVDLAKFADLENAVGDFAEAAREGMSGFAPDLGRVAGTALAFGRAGGNSEDAHMVDLGALVTAAAKNNPALADRCAAVLSSLSQAVVIREAGNLVKDSTGISIYFPNRRKEYDANYDRWGHPAWRALLDAYYDAGAAASPEGTPAFQATDNQGTMRVEKDGLSLEGTLLNGQGVVDAWFAYGLVEKDQTVLLGDSQAEVSDDGTVKGFWNKTILTLRQGRRGTYGYLSTSDAHDGETLYSVPFAYYADNKVGVDDYQYAYLDMVTDSKDKVISSTLYGESADGMMGELSPRKGSRLVPLVEVVGPDGESRMEMTEEWGFDAADWHSIQMDCAELDETSEVYLELNAVNANDEGDWLYDQGVPQP
jgi:hypothetical protein